MKKISILLFLFLSPDNCTLSSSLGILNYGRNLLAPSSTAHLANIFEAYYILQSKPPLSFSTLFQNMTSSVEATTLNVVAGIGLVAKHRFEAGQVVALYPIHALGYAKGKEPPAVHVHSPGESTGTAIVGTSDLICWEDEARRFGVNCDDQVDFSYAMLDPSGRYVFDANPSRPLVNDLFVAHFVNDAAAANFADCNSTATETQAASVRYLNASLDNFNCVMTPFGPPPLMAYVTIKPVEKGGEFLASYGLDYWLGKVENEDEAARIGDILEASPEVRRELEKYDRVIDSVVEQSTAIVRSDLYKCHTSMIKETIRGYMAKKRGSLRLRMRRWLRRL